MIDEYVYLWAQLGALVRPTHYQHVLRRYGNLERAWTSATPDLFYGFFEREKAERLWKIRGMLDFKWITERMEEYGVQLLCVDEPGYPELLKQAVNAPPFLFVRGTLPTFHKSIAVVGTRSLSEYGKFVTENLVRDLTRMGFVIVSGLAIGIDTVAHQTTLEEGGITVAVLGSGVDNITPGQSRELGLKILKSGGAIVSEFPIGTDAAPFHFPQRNRIISGLTRGTLVTEGGHKSGALITADHASGQDKFIFAVPHPLTKTRLNGTNILIRKDKAHLIETARDIAKFMQFEGVQTKPMVQLDWLEKQIVELIKDGDKTIDDLAYETGRNVARLSEVLIELSLKGVCREMGRKWVLL
jgi:DNA processing protein